MLIREALFGGGNSDRRRTKYFIRGIIFVALTIVSKRGKCEGSEGLRVSF